MKDGRIRLHDGRTWTLTPAAYAWLRKLHNHGPQKAWPPGIATGSNTMDAGWVEFVLSLPDGRNVRAHGMTRAELDAVPPERWWTHITPAGLAALQLSEGADADRQVVRKAMKMVVKSPKPLSEMEDEVRDFLRSASASNSA